MSTIILLDTGCCAWLCPWWLIWTLGAFLLGALLHYLFFCKGKDDEITRLKTESDGYHAKLTNAEKDRAGLQYQLDEAQKHIASINADLTRCEADKAGLQAQLAVGGGGDRGGLGIADLPGGTGTRGVDYAALLGSDNLQVVEGVGPKIEGLLKAAGFTTWSALGAASVDEVQKVLDEAGSRYRLADPKTWPRQAELAAAGKWDELIEFQKFLDTGRATTGDFATPSKVEKLIARNLGYSTNPEDLKIVEGIGPKIDGLLKDAGIKNWTDLAAASEEKLKEVLAAAGDRYRLADPSTWAKQAGLAAKGKWDELKEYQDYLSGGKDPSKA
jgi:predicted flap endonuclease-1-like 5' DNA nuclease